MNYMILVSVVLPVLVGFILLFLCKRWKKPCYKQERGGEKE